jgi:hypothetical protein
LAPIIVCDVFSDKERRVDLRNKRWNFEVAKMYELYKEWKHHFLIVYEGIEH